MDPKVGADRVRGEENNQAKGVTYIFAERRKAGCGTVHRDAREASSTLCGYTGPKGRKNSDSTLLSKRFIKLYKHREREKEERRGEGGEGE